MSADTRQRSSYHHGDLRRALLGAALELIGEKGTEGFSMRAVARRAGVSHMAPYHHFEDRAALVAAVAEEGFVLLRQAMLQRMEGADDPPSQLQESGIGYVLFAARHEAHFRVMFSAELADKSAYPALQAASEASYEVLAGAVARCQEAGRVREGDPQALSRAAWALVHGLAMLLIDGHLGAAASTGQQAREATRVLWQGLRA